MLSDEDLNNYIPVMHDGAPSPVYAAPNCNRLAVTLRVKRNLYRHPGAGWLDETVDCNWHSDDDKIGPNCDTCTKGLAVCNEVLLPCSLG